MGDDHFRQRSDMHGVLKQGGGVTGSEASKWRVEGGDV